MRPHWSIVDWLLIGAVTLSGSFLTVIAWGYHG